MPCSACMQNCIMYSVNERYVAYRVWIYSTNHPLFGKSASHILSTHTFHAQTVGIVWCHSNPRKQCRIVKTCFTAHHHKGFEPQTLLSRLLDCFAWYKCQGMAERRPRPAAECFVDDRVARNKEEEGCGCSELRNSRTISPLFWVTLHLQPQGQQLAAGKALAC